MRLRAGPVAELPVHPLFRRIQRVKARAAGRSHLGCSGKPSKSHLRCDPTGREVPVALCSARVPCGVTRKKNPRLRWQVGLSQRGLEGFDFLGDLQVALLEGDGMALLADFPGAVLLVDLEE